MKIFLTYHHHHNLAPHEYQEVPHHFSCHNDFKFSVNKEKWINIKFFHKIKIPTFLFDCVKQFQIEK